MTPAQPRVDSVVVPAGTGATILVQNNLGPADRTWVILVGLRIQIGTCTAKISYQWGAYARYPDQSLLQIASSSEVANEWNYACASSPTNDYSGTLTTHDGQTLDLYLTLRNWDTTSFTFTYSVTFFSFTD